MINSISIPTTTNADVGSLFNNRIYQRPSKVIRSKHAAWRLQRKWFNRYNKKQFIGLVITQKLEDLELKLRITNAKIKKEHGHYYSIQFEAKLA